jgi:YfiH family protein
MITDLKKNFIHPNWPVPANIRAYSTLRNSKISQAQPETAPKEAKPGNIDWSLLQTLLQLPAAPIRINQVHGTIAVEAEKKNENCAADAIFTDKINNVCAILTADCLPILLCHRQGTHVAAIHAGWRGLANGVIEATLQKLNLAANEIVAWLGPAIGPSKFEVREDVYTTFMDQDPEAKTCFKPLSTEQWLGDLYALAIQRLQRYGITQIYGGEYCTYSDEERFFSYRRDGKMTGRIVSLIWIEDSHSKIE